jgi:hypothetical protein
MGFIIECGLAPKGAVHPTFINTVFDDAEVKQ